MTESTKSTVATKLNSAGKATLKGMGIFAGAAITVLADAARIQKRDEVRQKLSIISDYDLHVALEIIQDRINKK